MTVETTGLSSRRVFLSAMVGAGAAVAAHALGRPLPTRAADGDPVIAGEEVAVSDMTTLRNTTTHSPVFAAFSDGNGVAIAGQSQGTATAGVQGIADATDSSGVRGMSQGGVGVGGSGGYVGVFGSSSSGIGMWGSTTALDKPAVVAHGTEGTTGLVAVSGQTLAPINNAPLDTAVYAYAAGYDTRSPAKAVGVHADAHAAGTALKVTGRASFSRSGKLSLATGKSSFVKSVPGLTSSSLVFAVVQSGDGGAWVRKVSPAAGKFTVRMNKAVSRTTTIAWIAFG